MNARNRDPCHQLFKSRIQTLIILTLDLVLTLLTLTANLTVFQKGRVRRDEYLSTRETCGTVTPPSADCESSTFFFVKFGMAKTWRYMICDGEATCVIPQILRWQLYVIAFSCKSKNCIHLMMV